MRNVLATDIKNNIRSIRFILGIFLIVSATLMSEHEMLQKIINAGGSAEGPGWFVAYTYCMNSVNMLLFVPIARCHIFYREIIFQPCSLIRNHCICSRMRLIERIFCKIDHFIINLICSLFASNQEQKLPERLQNK